MEKADLQRRFNYHKPDEERAARHQVIREVCLSAAEHIDANVPDGREKSLAITKLEEAMFWGNAAIAREGK